MVVAIGAAGIALGLWLAVPQLRRNDALRRTPTIVFTTRAASEARPPCGRRRSATASKPTWSAYPKSANAAVGLFGAYPDVEMRAVIDVTDDADLDHLPDRVDEVFQRAYAATGVRLDPIHISVRFSRAHQARQLQ